MKLRRMLRRKLLFWAAVAALTLLAALLSGIWDKVKGFGHPRGLSPSLPGENFCGKLKSVSSLFIPISHRCKQKIKPPGSLVMQEAPGVLFYFAA